MPKEKIVPFNILMTATRHAKLTALAAKMALSKSAVGRMAIDNMYTMVLGNQPTCASGQNCFVPHMHKLPDPIPPPPTPRDTPSESTP